MQHFQTRRILAVAGLLGCTWLAQGCCGPKEQVTSLRPMERSALAAAALAPEFESLRAGAEIERAPLSEVERTQLAQAAQNSAELEALRAGDLNLDNHELKIIGITAAVVVLIIIIA
ncbi:MAG: hypothetical protein EPO68_03440 [Planctomycetota bacterium]|nr:MAG: hypothetical protein EPO68_03440 [Planctomycetota bacterium]